MRLCLSPCLYISGFPHFCRGVYWQFPLERSSPCPPLYLTNDFFTLHWLYIPLSPQGRSQCPAAYRSWQPSSPGCQLWLTVLDLYNVASTPHTYQLRLVWQRHQLQLTNMFGAHPESLQDPPGPGQGPSSDDNGFRENKRPIRAWHMAREGHFNIHEVMETRQVAPRSL